MPARLLIVVAACGLLAGCAALGNAKTASARRLAAADYRICPSLGPGCTAANVLDKPIGMNLATQKSRFRRAINIGPLVWRHWGAGTATGLGVAEIFHCKRYCKDTPGQLLPPQGTDSSYLVVIVAADPKPWHGKMVYTRVTASVPAIGWYEVYDKDLLPQRQPPAASAPHASTPGTCAQQFTAWNNGPASTIGRQFKPAFRQLAATLARAQPLIRNPRVPITPGIEREVRQLQAALARAGAIASKLIAYPMPHCADPAEYWQNFLSKLMAAAANTPASPWAFILSTEALESAARTLSDLQTELQQTAGIPASIPALGLGNTLHAATPTPSPTPKLASAASDELVFARAMAASVKAVPDRVVAGSLMLTYIRFEHAYDAAWAAAGQPNAVARVARIAGGFKLCQPATSNIVAGCVRFTRFTLNQAGQVTGLSVDGEPINGRLASGPAASSGGLRISGVVAYRLTGGKAVAVAFKLTDTGFRPENVIPAVFASLNGASEDTRGREPLPNFLAPGDVLYAAALFDVTQVTGTFCLQSIGAGQLPCTRLSKI